MVHNFHQRTIVTDTYVMILSKSKRKHSTNRPHPTTTHRPTERMSSFFGGGGAPAPANNQQLKMAKAEVKMYSDLFNK